ncbi:TPA: glycosyltransferase [Klebsiella aerogenes]|uniref:glycosyltransferase family 2 protein n=1 Tax=Klebsiella aerogenes TaxID=548 RepID=UPI00063C3376|nr:glycosyltransferase [Klebsiella aerogenes]KLE49980.1 hypothetical protein YA11_12295 [Klebsiella aerogenes]MEB7619759.1 glycosyltransferase [Klebsiella aerogenes]HDT0389501.1 glycosyltransferase [Klebsiella aerogenes]HEO9732223.1 glycosyltransferase [Klebsiella aerogenes]
MKSLIFSVIVPTYNDGDELYNCIDALLKQSLDKTDYEIIIADNNKERYEYKIDDERVIFIHEPKPGSYAARNKAISIARGEYIAFTDSDCIVAEDWLEKGLECLKAYPGRVAGKISLYDKDMVGPTFSACYEKVFSFNQESHSKKGISVTANLLVPVSLFKNVGLFNDNLLSGGDIEWNIRAQKENIPMFYGDEVVIYHPIRATISQILKKRKRVLGGTYQNITLLELLKLLSPPTKAIKDLNKKNDLTLSEKIKAYSVCYLLKLYSFMCVVCLKIGVIKAQRS